MGGEKKICSGRILVAANSVDLKTAEVLPLKCNRNYLASPSPTAAYLGALFSLPSSATSEATNLCSKYNQCAVLYRHDIHLQIKSRMYWPGVLEAG